MPDFSKLLRTPAGEAKAPPALPIGDYPGLIKGYEVTENTFMNPPQSVIRLMVGLTGWADSVPEEDRSAGGVAIELSRKQFRKDYEFNPEAPGVNDRLYQLDELIRGLGIESNGRGYEEILPELTNQPVLVPIQQYMNKRTNEIGNQVGKLVPLP